MVFVVPSEGAGFFLSLVPGLALAQAITVEVAFVDSDYSRSSIAAAETSWEKLKIMQARQ